MEYGTMASGPATTRRAATRKVVHVRPGNVNTTRAAQRDERDEGAASPSNDTVPGLLDSAIHRVAECTSRINGLRDQVDGVGDHVLGVDQPRASTDGPDQPSGSANVLHYSIAYLERAIDELHAKVQRLHEL